MATTIVHLASSGELGGAERVILDILSGLRGARPDWVLQLIVPRDGPLARQASAIGVGVTVVPWSPALTRLGDAMESGPGMAGLAWRLITALPSVARDAVRMSRAIRKLRPALVHAHGFKMQVLGIWTRTWATPLVLHLHDYVAARRLVSRILGVTPPGPITAVAISKHVGEDARRVFGRRIRIEVVYNGIDVNEWTANGAVLDLDAAAGLSPAPPGVVRIGLVATMARWKGHETFLRAMSLIPRSLPVRGYVIGGSIYETEGSQHTVNQLRSMASELGLAERVGFTGFVDEPAKAIRALDIVVHASVRPEPFGRVIIEGMATERAVVARANGGAAELFVPDVEAVACMTDAPSELGAALQRLVADPAFRRRLGAHGRARVKRDYSRERMTSAIVRSYDNMLTKS